MKNAHQISPLSHLWTTYQPWRWRQIGTLGLAAFGNLLQASAVFLFAIVVARLTAGESFQEVLPWMMGIVGCYAGMEVCFRICHVLKMVMIRELSGAIYLTEQQSALKAPSEYHAEQMSGASIQQINQYEQSVCYFALDFWFSYMWQVMFLLYFFFSFVLAHGSFGLVYGLWVVWYIAGVIISVRMHKKHAVESASKRALVAGQVGDSLQGVQIVESFSARAHEQEILMPKIRSYQEASTRSLQWDMLRGAWSGWNVVILSGILMVYASYLYGEGDIPFETLLFSLAAMPVSAGIIWQFGLMLGTTMQMWGMYVQALEARTRMEESFHQEGEAQKAYKLDGENATLKDV